jgi:DNA-binding PadR family transcriptional regulator
MYERKILLGFIRVHILHHATTQRGVYGGWMIDELAHHGYKISPGTLYPILHDMEQDGVLQVEERNVNGKLRKIYRTTSKGEKILDKLKNFVYELSQEVLK